MTRLLLDMHEPYNRSHIKFLKDSMQSLLDNDGLKDQYTIFAYHDVLDNSSKVSVFSFSSAASQSSTGIF
jgi:hypothetical protein